MMQERFFDIAHLLVIGGCALAVVIIISIIHHRVGKITRFWDPRWASFFLSALLGAAVQYRFVDVLEPVHIPVIAGNILLIYLSAVGINAVMGKPVEVLMERVEAEPKGPGPDEIEPMIIMTTETWRTRWFD